MVGQGGIYSTTADLHQWQQALEKGQIISKRSWHVATKPANLNDGSQHPYGFGWALKPKDSGEQQIGHSGHWRGFKAPLQTFPNKQQSIILLINNGEDDSVDESIDAIKAILDGSDASLTKQPLDFALYPALQHSTRSATELFNQATSTQKHEYDINESALNSLGYDLIKKKAV